MPDIKLKQKNELMIKKFDRAAVYTTKMKNKLVTIKQHTDQIRTKENEQNNEKDYGANQIQQKTRMIVNKGKNDFNKHGRKSVVKTKENVKKANVLIKKKIDNYNIKKKSDSFLKANQSIFKTQNKVNKTIKNTPKRIKQTTKLTKKSMKVGMKSAKKTYQITKITAKNTIKTTKATVKMAISTIKVIMTTSKAIITALLAGGWIAAFVIIIICLIGLVCSSIFGIFFSNEKGTNSKSMSSVVSEINIEFNNKITDIQKKNEHDDFEIKSNRAEWKDVISVYAVLISSGKEQSDVVTLDDKKIEKLKSIFWEMNTISSEVREFEKEIDTGDDKAEKKKEKRKVLYITITSKTVDEMIKKYNMNNEQIKQLAEIRKSEYNSMWSNVLYGSSAGSSDIVQVAFSQIGNVGGNPYWSWYGFKSRVSWCACFVSWCANECGYIDSGIIPKFAACESEGVSWFKTCGLWQDGGYIPKAGDIIFFDWADKHDGHSDHVGIVERVENGRVYTIEGNSNDSCRQCNYDLYSTEIEGYGTPMY